MYVVFEGIEGSGKDSQANRLADYLTGPNRFPLRINEPDDTLPIGKLLRTFLASGSHTASHAALFLADRMAVQTSRVLPFMAQGGDVVCSRSFLSSFTYQQEQWPLEWLMDIHKMMPAKPDYIFIMDVDPEVGLQRVDSRGQGREVYEALEFQIRNRKRYLDLADDPRMKDFMAPGGKIFVFDATDTTQDAIHHKVLRAMGYSNGW